MGLHKVPAKGPAHSRCSVNSSPLPFPSPMLFLLKAPKSVPSVPPLVPSWCQDALPATPFPCLLTGQVLPPSTHSSPLPWALLPALLGSQGSKDGTQGVAPWTGPHRDTTEPPRVRGPRPCRQVEGTAGGVQRSRRGRIGPETRREGGTTREAKRRDGLSGGRRQVRQAQPRQELEEKREEGLGD